MTTPFHIQTGPTQRGRPVKPFRGMIYVPHFNENKNAIDGCPSAAFLFDVLLKRRAQNELHRRLEFESEKIEKTVVPRRDRPIPDAENRRAGGRHPGIGVFPKSLRRPSRFVRGEERELHPLPSPAHSTTCCTRENPPKQTGA